MPIQNPNQTVKQSKSRSKDTKGFGTPVKKPSPTEKIRGEANGQSKLNATSVRAIRGAKDDRSQSDLAKQHGVSTTTISKVIAGSIWSHVK